MWGKATFAIEVSYRFHYYLCLELRAVLLSRHRPSPFPARLREILTYSVVQILGSIIPRKERSLRGSSGIDHPITAIGVDKARHRVVVISSEVIDSRWSASRMLQLQWSGVV